MLEFLAPYAPIIAAALGVAATAARQAKPAGHFFHTPFGQFCLAAGAGACGALAQWVTGPLSEATLVSALAGAVSAAAGMMDPGPKLPSGTPTYTTVEGGKQ